MADNAPRDENRVVSLLGASNINGTSPVTIYANPSTHRLYVDASFSPSGTQDVNLTEVGGIAFSLGQQLAASSLPVVLTAAQITTLTPLSTVAVTQSTSPWVVSLTSTTITGTVAAAQSGTWNIGTLTTITNPVAVTGTFWQATQPVSATDLDIRNLVFATDKADVSGSAITTSTTANTTATLTNVASSASSVTILASNANRKGATIVNESTALLYVKFGSTASATSYVVSLVGSSAAPYSYYEVPFGYSGIITGIWASANGNARVTEVTA